MHPIVVKADHLHPGPESDIVHVATASRPAAIPVLNDTEAPLQVERSRRARTLNGTTYRQAAMRDGIVSLVWTHEGLDEAVAMIELFEGSTISVDGDLWTHRYEETSAQLAGPPRKPGKNTKKLLQKAATLEKIARKWREEDPSSSQMELVQDLERRARKARKKAGKIQITAML